MHASKQTKHSTPTLILAAIPAICCVVAIVYLQYQITQFNTRIGDDTHVDAIAVSAESNKLISVENSIKIDKLYQQVVHDTVIRFRSDDMQEWIKQFKEENPELHIPDYILDSQ